MNRRAIDALMWLKALKRSQEVSINGDIRVFRLYYRAWHPVCWLIYAWLIVVGALAGIRSAHELFNAGYEVKAFVNRASKRRHRKSKKKKGGNHENLTLN